MFQAPTEIWRQVAQTGPAPTSRWGRAMAGGQEAIDRLLREVEREQVAQRIPDSVTLAFEVVAPLMVESDRVEEYLRKTDRYDLMQALPSLPTPEVAAEIGAAEYRLRRGTKRRSYPSCRGNGTKPTPSTIGRARTADARPAPQGSRLGPWLLPMS